jgi:putative oligomerization/nucleic acid binding protein
MAKGLSLLSAPSKYEQLKQLGELRASGVLTETEFEAEKAKILAQP